MPEDELLNFDKRGYRPRTFQRPKYLGYSEDEHSHGDEISNPNEPSKPVIAYDKVKEEKDKEV